MDKNLWTGAVRPGARRLGPPPSGRAAALSDGEFVVPADVVSMMGDGSSNAGARRLYDLVKQIREAKTGTDEQAGPLPVGTILKRSLS